MLLLTGAALGALAGRLAGGSFWNLATLRFRWPWLVVIALLVKELALFTPLSGVGASAFLYVLSLWILVAWALWHRDMLPGISLVAAGMAANLLVIAVNLGHMPIAPELVRRAPAAMADKLLHDHVLGQYVVAGPDTQLNWLGDTISLPGVIGRVYPQAYSLGDLIALAGVFTLLLLAVCPNLLRNRRQLPIDVEQSTRSVIVTASIAGFDRHQVHVAVEERFLLIEAKAGETGASTRLWRRRERLTGNLRRRIRLPAPVDPEGAVATIRDGVLNVTIPIGRVAGRDVPVQEAAPAPAAEEPQEWRGDPQGTAAALDWGPATGDEFVDSEPPPGERESDAGATREGHAARPQTARVGRVFRSR